MNAASPAVAMCKEHRVPISRFPSRRRNMSTAHGTIDVNVPIGTAYNQWTQFESFPDFMSGIESVTQIDDVRSHWVTSIGGVEREFDAEVTDQLPDHHIAWRAVGELKQGGRVDFTPLDDVTTQIDLTVDWDPQGFVEKAGSVFQVDESIVRADLERFREFIERR